MDPEEYLYECLRNDHQLQVPGAPIRIYIQKVEGRKLIEAVLKHQNAAGKVDYVAHAREAELKVSPDKKKIHIRLRKCEIWAVNGDEQGYLEEKDMEFDLPKHFTPR